MAEHIRGTARRRRNHRAPRRKAYATFITGLAIMVVLGTVMSLIQPAATLNADVLTCTQEEHTHSEECYTLTCGLEEDAEHTHTEECYALTCGLEEHVHSGDCYASAQEESAPADESSETENVTTGGDTPADEPVEEESSEEDVPEEPVEDESVEEEPAGDGVSRPAQTFEQTLDSGVTVRVDAPEGALPEGVELRVELLGTSEDDSEEIVQAAGELDEAGVDYDGFVALDISFADAEGAEVEPLQPVAVSVELPQDLLPEEADPESLTVRHHAEQSDGEVTVETVADAAEETDGTVQTADTAVQADFEVESFSTFTITYSDGDSITVHLVDENGDELSIDTGAFDDLSYRYDPRDFADKFITNQWVNMEELASTWAYVTEGYTYQGAYRVQTSGGNSGWDSKSEFYWIRYNTTGGNSGWRYSTAEDAPNGNGSPWNDSWWESYEIYLVYTPVTETGQSGNLVITDSVASDGTFTAAYTPSSEAGTDTDNLYYVWQEWNETERAWETITRRKVNGDEYLLSENGQTLNVALQVVGDDNDEGGGWYRVSVYESQAAYESGTAALATSESYQLSYYDQLQNGSFETPDVEDITSGSNYQYPVGTDSLIWRTTGEDQQIEIVNATNDLRDGASDYNNGDGAVVGEQYAELNCQAAGALYQDVLTVPGTTLNWQFSHRGRNGEDTMYLLIAPTEAVEDITTQDRLESLVSTIQRWGNYDYETDSYTYTDSEGNTYFLVSQTTGNTDWSTRSGAYTVGEGQYLTRFFFVAGDTASQNDTVGNLLDNVFFTTGLLPAQEGQANLQITKVVTGVTDLPDDYSVTVTVTGGSEVNESVTLSNFSQQTNGTWTATGYVRNIRVPANENVILTVTETIPSAITGYTGPRTTVQVGNGAESAGASTTITLVEQDTGVVTFTNAYTPDTADLTLTKSFDGVNGADVTAEYSFTITQTEGQWTDELLYGDVDGVTFENGSATVTVDRADNWSTTIQGLPKGSYTVTETSTGDITVDEQDYYLAGTTYDPTNGVVDLQNDTTVTVTNTYEPYRTVTITKDVTGDMGDTTHPFAFTTSISRDGTPVSINISTVGSEGFAYEVALTENSDTAELTADGYTLADGDTLTIGKLKKDDVVTVVETEAGQDGYTTTYDGLNEENEVTVGTNDVAITVTNHRDPATPTNVDTSNTTPFALLTGVFALAGVSLAGVVVRQYVRRRRAR